MQFTNGAGLKVTRANERSVSIQMLGRRVRIAVRAQGDTDLMGVVRA